MFRKLMYLFAGLVSVTTVACSSSLTSPMEDSSPVTVMAEQSPANLKLLDNLGGLVKNLTCIDPTNTAAVIIGPKGGDISIGGVKVTFPAGAVSKPTLITMLPVLGKQAVQVFPHGLKFPAAHQPVMTFDIGCLGKISRAVIVYTDDKGNKLEYRPSTISKNGKTISAPLEHFSKYEVEFEFSQYAVDW